MELDYDFSDIPKEVFNKMSLEELYKLIDEHRVKAGLPPMSQSPSPFFSDSDDQNTKESEEELPPETRISATPIGSGFVNIINLDEPVRERIRRSLSPPLQEPRHHDSSDSDSDFDDVEFIMKRPTRVPLPRPPSRRQYIIERSKSPIDISPVVSKHDIKRKEENEILKNQILKLQNDNQTLKKEKEKLQFDYRLLNIKNQTLESSNKGVYKRLCNLREQYDELQRQTNQISIPPRRQYIIERPKSPIEIAPVINRIGDQMAIENQALKRRIFQLQTDNMKGQKQIQQLQNEDQKNKRYIKNLSDYTEDLCTQISNLQSENSIYKKHITDQINKQNKN